jgi:hypothetical protein
MPPFPSRAGIEDTRTAGRNCMCISLKCVRCAVGCVGWLGLINTIFSAATAPLKALIFIEILEEGSTQLYHFWHPTVLLEKRIKKNSTALMGIAL